MFDRLTNLDSREGFDSATAAEYESFLDSLPTPEEFEAGWGDHGPACMCAGCMYGVRLDDAIQLAIDG